MSLLYSAYTSQHSDTSYTWLERRLANICGLSIKYKDFENLNVQYYNENILNILFQMYSVMYNDYFPSDTKSYMQVDLLNPNIFEPIFHMVDRNENVIHVFYPDQIRAYFNYQDVGKTMDVKQLDVCRRYLLEAKSSSSYLDIIENREEAVILNELQSNNIIKLYVLCDHAMEHLSYYYANGRDERNFDKTHIHFGSDARFLSSLISQVPKKQTDELVYDRSMGAIEKVFSIRYDDQDGDCDSDEHSNTDEDELDSDMSIAKFLNT